MDLSLSQSSSVSEPKKRAENWIEKHIYALIEIWQTYINDLRSQRRNSGVYQRMSADLSELGIQKTAADVKTKIQNLTRIYRKEKAKLGSGCGPTKWKFWNAVHAIIGTLPINDDGRMQESLFAEENTVEMEQNVSDEMVLDISVPNASRSEPVESGSQQIGTPSHRRLKRSRNEIEEEKLKIIKEMHEEQLKMNLLTEEYDREILQLMTEQKEIERRRTQNQEKMLKLLNDINKKLSH